MDENILEIIFQGEKMIKIYDRQTKQYETEKIAGKGLIKGLYNTTAGKLGLELFIKRKLYSRLSGFFCDTGLSARNIQKFIDDFGIDMSICKDNIEDFKSFNQFFTRRLKPGARVFSIDPVILPSPGDGRVRAWTGIDVNKLVQVKGITYTLEELLADKQLADRYQGGICLILRLAPVDYHRFHFVDSGTCSQSKKIKGHYYSVNPIALNSIRRAFCLNKREYSILHSENFKDILYMEIGATSVGAIVQTYTPGSGAARGDEKGYFKFGGSTVILFLEKGAAHIDEEILYQTQLGYETRVLAGDEIGRKI